MLKYLLTAIYLGILICVLYQPIPITDFSSMVDQYRPTFKLELVPDSPDQSSKNNLNAFIKGFQKDSISINENYVFVDSTPIIP